jgi:hypothetical protein
MKKLLFFFFFVLFSFLQLSALPAIVQYKGIIPRQYSNFGKELLELSFKIFDSAQNKLLWQETHESVHVHDGIFSVELGSVVPFPEYMTGNTYAMSIYSADDLISTGNRITIQSKDKNQAPLTLEDLQKLRHERTPRIYFVNCLQPIDSGDGLSWKNAKKYLQSALALALPGDAIWVARGIYKPIDESSKEITDSEILKGLRFQIKDGISVFGGFAGDENPNSFNITLRDIN